MLMEMTRRNEASVDSAASEPIVTVRAPDSAIEGIIDVVTLRGLARAIFDLSKSNKKRKRVAYTKAMTRVFNVNDSLARAISELIPINGKR